MGWEWEEVKVVLRVQSWGGIKLQCRKNLFGFLLHITHTYSTVETTWSYLQLRDPSCSYKSQWLGTTSCDKAAFYLSGHHLFSIWLYSFSLCRLVWAHVHSYTHRDTHALVLAPSFKSSRHLPPLQYLIGPNTCQHAHLFPPVQLYSSTWPHFLPGAWVSGTRFPLPTWCLMLCFAWGRSYRQELLTLVGMSAHHGPAHFIIFCTPFYTEAAGMDKRRWVSEMNKGRTYWDLEIGWKMKWRRIGQSLLIHSFNKHHVPLWLPHSRLGPGYVVTNSIYAFVDFTD